MLSWTLQCIHGGKKKNRVIMWMNNNESEYDPVESHLCLGRKSSVFVESDQLQLCHQKPPGITLLTLPASHASANSHPLRQSANLRCWTSTPRCCRCGFKLDWPGTDRIHIFFFFFLLIFFLLIYIKLDIRAIKCVLALLRCRIWIGSFSNIVGNTSKPAGCTIYVLVLFPREPRDFTTERFSS